MDDRKYRNAAERIALALYGPLVLESWEKDAYPVGAYWLVGYLSATAKYLRGTHGCECCCPSCLTKLDLWDAACGLLTDAEYEMLVRELAEQATSLPFGSIGGGETCQSI
jgi:hypothetical protein